MSNIGAGETRKAYLIKKDSITDVDSLIKTGSPIETILSVKGVQSFKYRYLTEREMTFQPITGYLKGKFDKVLFTSETNIVFNERDFVMFEDNSKLRITRIMQQSQHGAFLISKKPPHIIELE